MLRVRSVALRCARVSATAPGFSQSAAATWRMAVVRRFAENTAIRPQDATNSAEIVNGVAVTAVQQPESAYGAQGTPADGQASNADAEKTLLRKIHVVSDQADKVVALVEQGRQGGIKSLDVYNKALRVLRTSQASDKMQSLVHKADSLVHKMTVEDELTPDLKTLNNIISFYTHTQQRKKVEHFYNQVLASGFSPDEHTYSHMIALYCREDKTEMYRIWRKMDEKKWPATRKAYLGLMSVMWRDKRNEDVLQIAERLRRESKRPTEATIGMALMAAAALARPLAAEALFADHRRAGFKPTARVYHSMMSVYYKAQQTDSALAYWRTLVTLDGIDGVEIQIQSYLLALEMVLFDAQWDEFRAILDLMHDRNELDSHVVFDMLLGRRVVLHSPVEQLKEGWKILTKERGLQPTSGQLMNKATDDFQHRSWEFAAFCFDLAHQAKATFTPQNYEQWLECIAKLRNTTERLKAAEVLKVWQLTREQGITTNAICHWAIKGAGRYTKAESTLEMIDIAKSAGVADYKVYHVAVTELSKKGSFAVARNLMEEMWSTNDRTQERQEEIYKAMLLACEKNRKTAVALSILDEMGAAPGRPRPSHMTVSFLVKALVAHERAHEVGPFLHNLMDAGIFPSDEVYAQVAEVCYDNKDRENCKWFTRKALMKRGRVPKHVRDFCDEEDPPAATSALTASEQPKTTSSGKMPAGGTQGDNILPSPGGDNRDVSPGLGAGTFTADDSAKDGKDGKDGKGEAGNKSSDVFSKVLGLVGQMFGR